MQPSIQVVEISNLEFCNLRLSGWRMLRYLEYWDQVDTLPPKPAHLSIQMMTSVNEDVKMATGCRNVIR